MSDDWAPNDAPSRDNEPNAPLASPADQRLSLARCVSVAGLLVLWIVIGATQALHSPTLH